MQRASAKAQTISKALGVGIGRVRNIEFEATEDDDSGDTYYPQSFYRNAFACHGSWTAIRRASGIRLDRRKSVGIEARVEFDLAAAG